MLIRNLRFEQISFGFPVEFDVFLPNDLLIANIRYRFGTLIIDVNINNEHYLFTETIGGEMDGMFESYEEEEKWLEYSASKIISCLDDKTITKFDL